MESVSLYSEARNEYLKQLSSWIVPPLVEFFRTQYSHIVSQNGHKRAMALFQEFCSNVPKWNQDVIESNVTTLLENCRCDYVEDLMTAVFIAHTKMLTAIRVNAKQKKLQITLPKLDHFLHRIFVECARSFWKAPFLFNEELQPIERQKNILQLESISTEALSSAVRSLLPVKTILRDYMNDTNDDAESSEDEHRSSKKSSKKRRDSSSSDSSSSSSESEHHTDPLLEELKSDIAADTISEISKEKMERAAPVMAALQEGFDTQANKPVTFIEKLETPPEIPQTHTYDHSVVNAEVKPNSVVLQKDPELQTIGELIEAASVNTETLVAAPASAPAPPSNPPQLIIDTEPSVHFTPYDTVYDENKSEISEIRYAPKVSVEDKPPSNWGMFDDDNDDEDIPKLAISSAASTLDADEVVDLEAPTLAAAPEIIQSIQPDDIDEPLTTTSDFEELS